MRYTIRLVTRLQDDGDGGYGFHGYNNEDDLIKDHPLSEKWDDKLNKTVHVELSPEQRKSILDEEDPYENGYIGTQYIEVEVIDGVARLSRPVWFHCGQ